MPDDPTLVTLPDGRRLAVDDVGDRLGRVVVFCHGTPDSRLARHPDDGLAVAAGVRLLAADRPGCGQSDPDPVSSLSSVADDLAAACAALGVGRAAVLAWSGGAPFAVAMAARHPELVTGVGIAAGLVPITAYSDPAVVAAAGPGRALFAEMAAEAPAEVVAAEVAPYLVPDPPTPAAVGALVAGEGDEVRAAELALVPGATDQMVAAMIEAVRRGPSGITRDVVAQAAVPDVDLVACRVRVRLWYGTADPVAPPAFGHWWASVLPQAELTVLDGAGHMLALTRWAELLRFIALCGV